MTILPLVAFVILLVYITHRRSNLLDKQVKDMAIGFLERDQQFDVTEMKSSAVYSIVYRVLPQAFTLVIALNIVDKGFFTVLCIVYLVFQLLKAALQLTVMFNITSQSFAERVVEGYKGST